MIGTLAAMIGSGMVVRSIPYEEGFGAKQIAWMVHSGVVGAVIAPLTLLGGPIMMRAALYTAGVVGSKFVFIENEHEKCMRFAFHSKCTHFTLKCTKKLISTQMC